MSAPAGRPPTPAERIDAMLRAAILHGEFAPGEPLKPKEIADEHGVSLAVVRESLLRLVAEGLAERRPNRGFVVPAADDDRWLLIAETRAVIEPAALRLAIARGGLEWEIRVQATHRRLAGTPLRHAPDDVHVSDSWSAAHRDFHRALLEGCQNDVMLDTIDRLFTASELTRRWLTRGAPSRDFAAEHRGLEQAALARDADLAAELLAHHVGRTAAELAPGGGAPPSTARLRTPRSG